MDVVRAICAGHTSREELSEALGMNHATIKTHLYNIYGKLYIKNITALCLYAIRAGWCDEYGQIKTSES
jgi:DNA-binding CsgD family transcriptional regulator